MASIVIENVVTHVATGPGVPASVAGVTGTNWMVEMLIPPGGIAPGCQASIRLEESEDGFVNDIKTLAVMDGIGDTGDGQRELTLLRADRPTARIGGALCNLRLNIQTLTGTAAAVTTSLIVTY